MSDPIVNRRPTTVTAAGYLLYLVAAALVVNAVGLFAIAGRVGDAARRAWAAAPSRADQYAGAYRSGLTIAGAVFLLVAAGLVALALFDLRGARPARIMTWIAGGLLALCCGCLGVGQLFGGSGGVVSGNQTQDGVNVATANQQIADAFPGWTTGLFIVLLVVGLPGLIAAIVLLVLPSSGAYFRGDDGSAEEIMPYPLVPDAPPAFGEPPVPPQPAVPPPAQRPAAEDEDGDGDGDGTR